MVSRCFEQKKSFSKQNILETNLYDDTVNGSTGSRPRQASWQKRYLAQAQAAVQPAEANCEAVTLAGPDGEHQGMTCNNHIFVETLQIYGIYGDIAFRCLILIYSNLLS